MGTYDAQIEVAAQLIAQFGKNAELKVLTTTDGANPWDAGVPTEQVAQAPMVFLNFRGSTSGETYWNGELVQQGDKKVLLAAKGLPFEPNLNALVTRPDGSVWKVVNLARLDPDGDKILYTMQVRQ